MMNRAVTTLLYAALTFQAPSLPSQQVEQPVPVVELRLLVDGEMTATVRVRIGDHSTVKREGKPAIWLLPSIAGSLLVLKINQPGIEQGDGVELGNVSLEPGEPLHVTAGQYEFEIVWTDLIQATSAGSDSQPGPCSSCCVVCDGGLVCGCVVETPCGRCCCPNACDCPSGPLSQSGGSASCQAAAGKR
jgi:hypothetical protein